MKDESPLEYYPESWYPVCLSQELKRGEVREIPIFNTKLTLFRTQKGQAGLIKTHCSHMGTKLCNGKVDSDGIICPLHHRKFNTKGECISVLGTDHIPNNAKHLALPIKEDFGIVFAYLGTKVNIEFPSMPKAQTEPIFCKAKVHTLDIPYESLIFNGFDTHHLGCIHFRELTGQPVVTNHSEVQISTEYGMRVLNGGFYDWLVKTFNADVVHNLLDCFGGNLLVISCEETKDNVLMATTPIDKKRSQIYLTSITEGQGLSSVKQFFTRLRLSVTTRFAEKFLEPDLYILPGLDPNLKNFYPEQDQGAMDYWKYFMKLPRDTSFQKRIRY